MNERFRLTGTEADPPVRTLTIPVEKYLALQDLMGPGESPRRRTKKISWDFVFNVGGLGEIFEDNRTGHTPQEERTNMRGRLGMLDTIANAAVAARGDSGRFFCNRTGVYYKNRDGEVVPCLTFAIQMPPQ